MAPQRLEKIESAPGNGMVSEALNPQDVVHGRAADRARLRLASRQNDEAKFSVSQPLEIAKSREGISESAPRISPPRSYGEGSGAGLFGPVDEALEVFGTGARPTPSLESGEARSAVKSKGNFPPRKALKSLETAKESRRPRRAEPYRSMSPNSTRGEGEGKFSASQSIEIARNRERISETQRPMGPDEGIERSETAPEARNIASCGLPQNPESERRSRSRLASLDPPHPAALRASTFPHEGGRGGYSAASATGE
jgi:hypothetical protein